MTKRNPRWQRVFELRDDPSQFESPPVRGLEASRWDGIEWRNGPDNIVVAHEPLDAIMFYLEMGFYPPPELLRWMLEAWGKYHSAVGALSLEDVFYGGLKPGEGSNAERSYRRLLDLFWHMKIDALTRKGMSPERAAELVIQENHITARGKDELIDASSLLRRLRRRKLAVVKRTI